MQQLIVINMKTSILLMLFVQSINPIKFSDLIGKDYSEVEHILSDKLDTGRHGKGSFYPRDSKWEYYYGMPYNVLLVTTNEQDIITSLTVAFVDQIDQVFYDLFAEDYGTPDTIRILDNTSIESEGILETEVGTQHLKGGKYTTREGTFEEEPLFMFWYREKFDIQCFTRDEPKITTLTFSIPKAKNM